jgi:hypothetical protein
MAVDAVVAEVELAADEPLGVGQIPFEDLVPGLEPVQVFGDAGPEGFRIVDGLLVEGLVLFKALDVGLGAELRRAAERRGFRAAWSRYPDWREGAERAMEDMIAMPCACHFILGRGGSALVDRRMGSRTAQALKRLGIIWIERRPA